MSESQSSKKGGDENMFYGSAFQTTFTPNGFHAKGFSYLNFVRINDRDLHAYFPKDRVTFLDRCHDFCSQFAHILRIQRTTVTQKVSFELFFCDGKHFEIFWTDCCHISYKTPEQLKDSGREIHPLFKEDYTYMLDGGPSHRYGMVEELGTDEESVAATVCKLYYSGRENKMYTASLRKVTRKRAKEVKAFKEVAHLNTSKASNALSDPLNETAAALLAQYKGNLAKFRKEAVELGVEIAGRSAKQIAKSVAEIMLQPPHQE